MGLWEVLNRAKGGVWEVAVTRRLCLVVPYFAPPFRHIDICLKVQVG